MMITETTISGFSGFDPNGIPEFVRARKAMQYSASIDDYARIMKEGNNGGYANNWLVADRKTNEVASLELGLKNVMLQRTKDGFFVGSNFPADPKLIKEETDFDPKDQAARARTRGTTAGCTLMEQNKGKIDVAAGAEVPGRPLRHVRRARRIPTSARCAATSKLRRAAWGHGSRPTLRPARCRTRSRTSASAEKMTLQRAAGPRLRPRLQGGGASGEASRIRLACGTCCATCLRAAGRSSRRSSRLGEFALWRWACRRTWVSYRMN